MHRTDITRTQNSEFDPTMRGLYRTGWQDNTPASAGARAAMIKLLQHRLGRAAWTAPWLELAGSEDREASAWAAAACWQIALRDSRSEQWFASAGQAVAASLAVDPQLHKALRCGRQSRDRRGPAGSRGRCQPGRP
ncbi:MAG: hypothetical protein ACOCZE_03445 [Planctomycetota bacterium]